MAHAQSLMTDHYFPRARKAGRRPQLNKFHRKRAQWLPKSELLIASLKHEALQYQRGW